MYKLLDKVGFTSYYKDGVQGEHDNIVEISLDFGLESMAKLAGMPIMRPNTKWEKVLRCAMFTSTFLLLFLTSFAFFVEKANFQIYLKLFQTMSTTIQIILRFYVSFINKKNLIQLRRDTSKFWHIEDLPKEQQEHYLWIYRLQNRIFQTYLIIGTSMIFAFHLKLLLGYVPLYTWNPKENSVGFWIVSCIVIIFLDSVYLLVIAFDSTFFANVINIMNQFDILQWTISNLNYIDLSVDEIHQKIDYFADYHAFLLNYINQIDISYSKFFLVQYCATALGLCAYMAFLTISSNLLPIEIFEVVVFTSILVYQFTLICLPLAEIESRADLIGNAVFHSSWYDNNGPYVRKLYFMMMRCQKSCQFTAGGMTEMNRKTLVKIFRLCFSVWALINTVSEVK